MSVGFTAAPRFVVYLLPAVALAAGPAGSAASQDPEDGSGRTAEAEITVDVADSSARVRATYRVEGRPPLELRTLRGSGQEVEGPVVEAGPLVPELERGPALVRVRARAPTDAPDFHRRYLRTPMGMGPPTWEVRVDYRVTGDLHRVPLFVPDLATDVDSRLELRLRGLDPGADLNGAFPRFEWMGEEEGAREGPVAVAHPPNLPSFLVLPARASLLTLNEAADLLVVVVVVGATGGWLLWRRREARRLRTGGEARRTGPGGEARRTGPGAGSGRSGSEAGAHRRESKPGSRRSRPEA